METNIIDLKELDAAGLEKLADLHCAVMHSLLTDLGREVVLQYYKIAQDTPFVIGICALNADRQIAAWAIGSDSPSSLNSWLVKSPKEILPIWFLKQVIRISVTRPVVLFDLLNTQINQSDANQIKPFQIELTYIGVSKSAQGQGLGSIILDAFIQEARRKSFRSICLSVESDNHAAIRLYTKFGFKIIRTYSEGHFERNRMELELN